MKWKILELIKAIHSGNSVGIDLVEWEDAKR